MKDAKDDTSTALVAADTLLSRRLTATVRDFLAADAAAISLVLDLAMDLGTTNEYVDMDARYAAVVRAPGAGRFLYGDFVVLGAYPTAADANAATMRAQWRERISVRSTPRPTPAERPAVDPDDPFANGLSLVRYENVFGRRPPGAPRKG